MTSVLPVVVLGAGPVGLAAAAHLLERGLEALVLEAAGEVAASPRDWGHVRLFSPWRYDTDTAAVRLLVDTGWQPPPQDDLPTGRDLYTRYLQPLANVPRLRQRLRLDRRVVAVTRHGLDKVRTSAREREPFLVRTMSAAGAVEDYAARAIIDATGTWWTPNPLGAAGIPAVGEADARDVVHYGIPDVLGAHRHRYAGRTTLVAGAGHSAANSILALSELAAEYRGTRILWATRGDNLTRVFGGSEHDDLPARGRLGADLRAIVDSGGLTLLPSFRVDAVRRRNDAVEVAGTRLGRRHMETGIDVIIAATGQRPDLAMHREVRLSLDPALESAAALAPLIDPSVHSCGTVRPHGAMELAHPEPDFYIIGSKSYGRAPTFLLATGYEQARSVVAMIAGDRDAAQRVELDLPRTGVCQGPAAGSSIAAGESSGEPAASHATVQVAGSTCCAPATGACC